MAYLSLHSTTADDRLVAVAQGQAERWILGDVPDLVRFAADHGSLLTTEQWHWLGRLMVLFCALYETGRAQHGAGSLGKIVDSKYVDTGSEKSSAAFDRGVAEMLFEVSRKAPALEAGALFELAEELRES